MEIPSWCSHAQRTKHDVLLLQASLPVQRHDSPLKNYTFNGVIWYQGESNVSRRNEYASLLTAMIADWRRTFNRQDLPFYIVELADFLSKDDIDGRKAWAEMRQEQAKAAKQNTHTTLIKTVTWVNGMISIH